ncbi:MAG TPA: hypothetical protein VNO81_00255, partial [Candidatus Nitrosotenuis sp.]|nr:hypothetical protein [Candidatus Nitrosotenuis sp.]
MGRPAQDAPTLSWPAALLLYLGAALVLAPGVLGIPFWQDDFLWLLQARDTRSPLDFFATGYIVPRPLCSLLVWAGWQAFGTGRAGYHALTLLLYAGTALALHRWVEGLTASRLAGLGAGLAFLVMEHHWEALASVACLGDLLAGLFLLTTLHGYVRWRRQGGTGWLAASLGFWAATLLSKEAALAGLALLALADLLLAPGPGLWRRQTGFWAVSGLWLAWQHLVGRGLPQSALVRSGLPLYQGMVQYALGVVLGYPLMSWLGEQTWSPLVWAGTSLGYGLALALTLRRAPVAAFHLLWIPVMLAAYVVSGPGSPFQPRYGYLSSLG